MFVEQLYTGCLSEAAYYIESDGEAAIIDPLRDIDDYLEIASQRKTTIKYIFETHFHADFVSGHLDLSKVTGATIVYGPGTQTKFPVHIARDGEVFKIGALTVEVLHTPGHTLESSCYLLKDENGKDHCIFTGDTLFVGDVGRPVATAAGLERLRLRHVFADATVQRKPSVREGTHLRPVRVLEPNRGDGCVRLGQSRAGDDRKEKNRLHRRCGAHLT